MASVDDDLDRLEREDVDFYSRPRQPDPRDEQPRPEIGIEPSEEELSILLSTVQPERVEWLWPGRIPLGKLTIIDGDPGLGKSVLTLDLAARVSRGLPMPDGSPGRQGGVVLLSAEDGLHDTIRPRLDAAGADCSRILALDLVLAEGGHGKEKRPPVLPVDVPYLAAAIKRVGALLIVVDPLTAFLGAQVNAHRDTDIRRALLPMARLAEETAAAVVVIRHLNKLAGGDPLYRGGGSIAIIGAARSGLLVAEDPDNADRRVLAATKCNLAKLPPSLGFELTPADNGSFRVGWIGESAHTAEGLLAVPKDGEEQNAIRDAVEVLRTILSAGQRTADDVKREARKAGISERTLARAKATLKVKSNLVGFGKDGQWYWSLRTPEDANPNLAYS
jgi:hypothetical protein